MTKQQPTTSLSLAPLPGLDRPLSQGHQDPGHLRVQIRKGAGPKSDVDRGPGKREGGNG